MGEYEPRDLLREGIADILVFTAPGNMVNNMEDLIDADVMVGSSKSSWSSCDSRDCDCGQAMMIVAMSDGEKERCLSRKGRVCNLVPARGLSSEDTWKICSEGHVTEKVLRNASHGRKMPTDERIVECFHMLHD